MNDKLIETFIEVKLEKKDDFLLVKETLSRIGIASNKEKKLYQTCHILHKQGRYFIVHFKELFALDGKQTSITSGDYLRRNLIAVLLSEWNLVQMVTNISYLEQAGMKSIKIVPFNEKKDWQLIPKYSIGSKRRRTEKNDSI